MRQVRESISVGRFPEFVQEFVSRLHPQGDCEPWAIEALASVNIKVNNTAQTVEK